MVSLGFILCELIEIDNYLYKSVKSAFVNLGKKYRV